ncbi:MAG: hypothetical protein ACOYVJ_03250 [Nitrospirota bacterium]
MTRNKGVKFFLFFGSILLSLIATTDYILGGSVSPLPIEREKKGGVTPLLGNQPQGSVTPLPIEEPDTRKIIAEGWANIYNGNVERARLAALRSAYAEAVSRGTGIEIGSLMLIRNVKQVSDIVMSRSKGFIRSYKIIKEGIHEKDPNKYEVLIEAEVVMEGSTKSEEGEGLRLYLGLLGNPKLLIMLPEDSYDSSKGISSSSLSENSEEIEVESSDTRIKIRKKEKDASSNTDIITPQTSTTNDQGSVMRSTEAAVAEAFSSHGYQVITSDDLLAQGTVDPEVLRQAKSGVTAQAVKVAKAAGADIALLGVIRVSKEKIKPLGVHMVMVVAEASAKALIVSSGRVVQAFHHIERASSPQELQAYADSLDRIAYNIADVLSWKIPHILTEDSRETKLIIHGIDDVAIANKLRDALIELPGIESVRFAKLPSKENKTAEFVLLTGFVMLAPDEVLEVCTKNIKDTLVLLKENKYEIELKVIQNNKSSNII